MKHLRHFKVLGFSLIILSMSGLPGFAAAQQAVESTIKITQVPPPGGGPDRVEMIAGEVRGVTPSDYRVVIFSHTDQWYVQPYVAAPYTSINKDGRWSSMIHLGYEYAALLVKPAYKPPTTTFTLPEVGREVIAIDVAPASQ